AAAAACRRALALAPAHGEAHYNLGIVMKDLGRNDDAIRAFAAALACRPSLAVAHANLGVVLREELRLDDALAAFERAGALDAAFAAADSNSLVTMLFMDRFTAAEVLAAHRRFGARHGHAERAAAWRMPDHRERDRDPERCLRIGYLSPQFVAAALGPVMAPVLAAHRRDRVSVHVFAHAPRPDRATERMQTLADRWTFINELDDERVAAAVAAAEIDILVHLMGHWADNRLTVLARRPAPIQALYQCSAPTSGLAEVDYALIDPWFDHDGRLGALMTERPIRLSGGFQVQIYDQEPQIGPPPMLARGHATFGSFNNPAKISDAAMALWARVMAAAPSARLLLRGRGLDRPSPAQALARRFAAAGLAPARIDMRGAVADQAAHLAGHDDIDVVLDTLPFTGGRTTLDALWMGVPVVTLPGDALYGRYSYSHLQRIGAVELIADSADSFVRKAVELATSPERLIDYRQRLRAMVRASPVMDVARHVDELEAAYRSMWRRWCKTPAAGG
ncbi:MAG: hypothetical protein FJX52_11005, partial [Alphaproteobacteria bacterium]|nr:hypothetical protein [Alphaproteobacteria bacterium]